MARKTKAELHAERKEAQAAREAHEFAFYPTLLMSTLERATKLGYELTVQDSMFVLRSFSHREAWEMTLQHSEDSQSELDDLVWEMDQKELRRLAAEAKAQAKAAALNKLTKEERELLGL